MATSATAEVCEAFTSGLLFSVAQCVCDSLEIISMSSFKNAH